MNRPHFVRQIILSIRRFGRKHMQMVDIINEGKCFLFVQNFFCLILLFLKKKWMNCFQHTDRQHQTTDPTTIIQQPMSTWIMHVNKMKLKHNGEFNIDLESMRSIYRQVFCAMAPNGMVHRKRFGINMNWGDNLKSCTRRRLFYGNIYAKKSRLLF